MWEEETRRYDNLRCVSRMDILLVTLLSSVFFAFLIVIELLPTLFTLVFLGLIFLYNPRLHPLLELKANARIYSIKMDVLLRLVQWFARLWPSCPRGRSQTSTSVFDATSHFEAASLFFAYFIARVLDSERFFEGNLSTYYLSKRVRDGTSTSG